MCMGSVGGCNVQCSCYTEHGRYGLSCLYAETVECVSVYGMYVMYGIWSIAAEHGRYIYMDCLLCGRLWSEQLQLLSTLFI